MNRPMTISDLSSPQEAAFVAALFELGGPQYASAAALRAGYASDETEAGRVAVHLLASPRINAAIAGETKARFEAATATAFRALVDVCANGRSESARISAAQEILNRGVGPIPSRSESIVARTTVEDILDRLDARTSAGSPAEAGSGSPPEIEHDPGSTSNESS